jgi:hypothetical protein
MAWVQHLIFICRNDGAKPATLDVKRRQHHAHHANERRRRGPGATNLGRIHQQQHDLSDRKGQAAGIDPVTGRIWFGDGLVDIVRQLQAEGLDIPIFLVRVGYCTYDRKGAPVNRTVGLERVP